MVVSGVSTQAFISPLRGYSTGTSILGSRSSDSLATAISPYPFPTCPVLVADKW